MATETQKKYAVFFTVNLNNKREADRLVLMRRFIESGLGEGVTILDETVCPDYSRYGLVVLAEASSKSLFDEAIKACEGVYDTTVAEVLSFERNESVKNPGFGLFAINTPLPVNEDRTAASEEVPNVFTRLRLDFAPDSPCTNFWLVQAPTFGQARSFADKAGTGRIVETMRAQPLKDFFEFKMGKKTAEPFSNNVAAIDRSAAAGANNSFTIKSLYNKAVYACSDSMSPFTADMAPRLADVNASMPASGKTYIWDYPIGYRYLLEIKYSNANNFFGDVTVQLGGVDFGTPIMAIPSSSNVTYEFNTGAVRFKAVTTLSVWLSDLLSSKKYDLPWPEDSYQGQELAAYNYILSKIPGNTPPKKGTLKEPTIIMVIKYPDNGEFSEKAFESVKTHLLLEVGHFVTVDQWFGPNGIINAINSKISILSTNDLIDAANLMSIPPQQSLLMVILDDVITAIIAIVAVIPGVGGFYAAVLTAGWEAAKIAIAATNNPPVTQPIQATIAQIADELNQYLIYMTNAAQVQSDTLYKNWGKLQEFSSGVIKGIISPGQFYPSGGVDERNFFSIDQPTKLPQQFLAAAADAWLIFAYQQLFAGHNTPTSTLSFSTTVPNNTWDPDHSNYHFTYTVPCIYKPGSKSDPVPGYMVFDCTTDAPAQVLQQLFGRASRLNIDPLLFFIGLNGWKPIVSVWYAGYQGIDMNIPSLPTREIGIPAWGKL
jgi:hypothetical protein